MIENLKAHWGQVFQISFHAFLKVVHLTAVTAVKVMVMPLVGAFITGGLSRNFYTADQALLLKVFQRPVDCCDTERRNGPERQPMDVVWQQGAFLFIQDSLDRFFLACGSSFDCQGAMVPVHNPYFKPSTMVLTL